MTINPTAAAGQAPSLYTSSAAMAAPKKDLDKEVFLTLLVTQLRNQDPTSPMDTTEMMAQSSQLASMEQLTGLADTSRDQFGLQMRMAASTFIGQEVTFIDKTGVKRTGTVTGAAFDGPVPTMSVGGYDVPLDSISAISKAGSAAAKAAAALSTPSSSTTPSSSATPSSSTTPSASASASTSTSTSSDPDGSTSSTAPSA